jgi:aminoglycoside 6'-N-acetyltransferase I
VFPYWTDRRLHRQEWQNVGMWIRPAGPGDAAALGRLCVSLWPDAPAAEHEAEMLTYLTTGLYGTTPTAIFLAEETSEAGPIGFVHVALRSHADQCDMAQRVGFLEGWFVVESRRRQGVGRALVAAAEAWARERGCREMASDTWVDHQLSIDAHAALGYEAVDRCVHFRKAIA